jgi:hypothetical protein
VFVLKSIPLLWYNLGLDLSKTYKLVLHVSLSLSLRPSIPPNSRLCLPIATLFESSVSLQKCGTFGELLFGSTYLVWVLWSLGVELYKVGSFSSSFGPSANEAIYMVITFLMSLGIRSHPINSRPWNKRVELESNKTPFVLLVSKKWQKITQTQLYNNSFSWVKLLNIGSYEMVNKCAYMASLPFPLLECLAPNMQWQP